MVDWLSFLDSILIHYVLKPIWLPFREKEECYETY